MKRLIPVFLVATSSLLAYLTLEAGYRLLAYHTIKNKIIQAATAQFPPTTTGTSIFDSATGYRYRPDITVERRDGPFPVLWKTNGHGHIARADYPTAKPDGEFRIGLIGDSMTANVTNTIRWGDVLEDHLNASAAWRAVVGDKTTRVINFGLDGIGTIQFGQVVDNLVSPFSVDLLIVNLISGDVARRPYYRGSSGALSADDFAKVIVERSVNKLPWLAFYPEALAVAAGRWLNLEPHLTLSEAAALLNTTRHFSDPQEAAERSADVARAIIARYPNSLWLEHPLFQDYVGYENPDDHETKTLRESYELFRKRTSEIDIVRMIGRLPKPHSREEIDSWYNVPHDQHNSDKGLRLYGAAVADLVIERFANNRLH